MDACAVPPKRSRVGPLVDGTAKDSTRSEKCMSDLPEEVLSLIMRSLDVKDKLRLGG